MAIYRFNRNLEASLIDFFREELIEDGWVGITVDLQTKKTSTLPAPKILISILDRVNVKREIGSGSFIKYPNIVVRIFSKNDGQRLDLSDWVLEKLEADIDYYNYIITNGIITSKIVAGNITVLKILRDEHELANTDPSVLDEEDRYRHNITFSCFVGQI